MEQQDTTPAADKRHRSPNFPAFSLVKALERAAILYEHERMSPVAQSVACEHWEVKITSSSGLRYLSAMRSFGLIEDAGSGRVKLTERAQVLLRHPNQQSPEYLATLRETALAPKIHAEIWAKYERDGLPSDKNLAWELETTWKFHPSAIDGLIAELRETFTLAGLMAGAKISATTKKEPDGVHHSGQRNPGAVEQPPGFDPMTPNRTTVDAPRELPLPLMSGGVAVLKLPHMLSEADFEWLKTMLDKLKGGIVAPSDDPS